MVNILGTTLKRVLAVSLSVTAWQVGAADICDSWTDYAHKVTMQACSYPDGKSGYYKVTNHSGQAARVCWTMVTNSGKTSDRCHSGLGHNESSTGSFFQCGKKNDGCQAIRLKSYTISK